MTFIERAIKETNEYLKKNKITAVIEKVSEEYTVECEWCSNRSQAVWMDFKPTSNKKFDKGFCCSGGGIFFEDNDFKSQNDWHVCGRCPNS